MVTTMDLEQLTTLLRGHSVVDLEREVFRRDFRAFVEAAWPVIEPTTPFVPGPHIDAICLHLQRVMETWETLRRTPDDLVDLVAESPSMIRKLLITIPPRMSKSTIVSVMWPAWVWIRQPGIRFLTSSYSADLAMRDAVRTRRLIMSNWYQERWGNVTRMAGDQNVKARYENTSGGYRIAIGMFGAATGEGGDVLLMDDPHNVRDFVGTGREYARNAVLDWWGGVFSSRRNDPKRSVMVVIQQRVHELDLAGHLLEQGGWVHLNMPMEYEGHKNPTPIGWQDWREQEGEFLAPRRFGPVEKENALTELGPLHYAGQYQQRPTPASGGILQKSWWRFWQYRGQELAPVVMRDSQGRTIQHPLVTMPRLFHRSAQSWDMTFKQTTRGSYVVGLVGATYHSNVFILDRFRARTDFPDTVKAVQDMSRAWPQVPVKLIEEAANGAAVIDTLRATLPGIIGTRPEGGKESRLNAVSYLIEAGNVILPHPDIAPWVHEFIAEATAFPFAAHDDQVDALTQLLRYLCPQGKQGAGLAKAVAHHVMQELPNPYARPRDRKGRYLPMGGR